MNEPGLNFIIFYSVSCFISNKQRHVNQIHCWYVYTSSRFKILTDVFAFSPTGTRFKFTVSRVSPPAVLEHWLEERGQKTFGDSLFRGTIVFWSYLLLILRGSEP